MNPNRQNNCYASPAGNGCGRPGFRQPMPTPANVIAPTACGNNAVPCCSDVPVRPVPCCSNVATQTVPCCSDVIGGGIIIGQERNACNKETTLSGLPIAMAYVPWQAYCNLYSQSQALRNGTLFQELDLDFAGRRCN